MLERLVEIYDQITLKLRLLLLFISCLLASYLGYTDNVEPENLSLEKAKKESENTETEITKINENFKQIITLEEELRKTEEELVSLFTLLPPDVETDRLLGAMSLIANETGVLIRSFNPGTPSVVTSNTTQSGSRSGQPPQSLDFETNKSTVQSPVRSHPIRIQFDGTYVQGLIFMDKLMEMSRIIKIDSIVMTPLQQKNYGSDNSQNFANDEKLTQLKVELGLLAFSQAATPTLSALSNSPKTMGQQGSQKIQDQKGGASP